MESNLALASPTQVGTGTPRPKKWLDVTRAHYTLIIINQPCGFCPSLWVSTGCLWVSACTLRKRLYNLKLSINLSVEWHRTRGGMATTLKNPTLPSLRGCFWFSHSPLSFLLESVILLCLIKLLLLKTANVSQLNSFPPEGKNGGIAVLPVTYIRHITKKCKYSTLCSQSWIIFMWAQCKDCSLIFSF